MLVREPAHRLITHSTREVRYAFNICLYKVCLRFSHLKVPGTGLMNLELEERKMRLSRFSVAFAQSWRALIRITASVLQPSSSSPWLH
jgi:hypothetical protein